MEKVGVIEALTSAIGETLNDVSGLRMTRTTAVVAEGATSAPVETTFGWPATGSFYMAGQLYTYSSKTISTLVGLSPPVVEDLRELTTIVDWSRSFSALDLARRALLVDYAEEEYLDTLGRNYGVFRFPGLDDATFRAAIKALAFAPKGTLATIETVLTYLVGAGNFEVFEDLVNFPNEVFITLDATVGADPTVGKTFFSAREEQTSLTSTTVDLTYAPLGLDTDSVQGVFLAPKLHHAYFDVLPSAEPSTPWTYTGTTAEGTVVTDNADGSFRVQDTSGADVGAQYTRALNAMTTSDIYALATVRRVASTADAALQLRLSDGTRKIAVGWSATHLFFYDATTPAQLGTPFTVDTAAHTIEIRKVGGAFAPAASVELWVDGVLRDSVAYASFPASAARLAEFGSFSAAGTSDSHWSSLEVYTRDYHVNYWNQRKTADGSVLTASPARLTSAGSFFSATLSPGRPAVVRGGTAAHGRNNGRYVVTTAAVGYVDLEGIEHPGLEILTTDTVRIPVGVYDAFTSEDAGVQASRATGTGLAGLTWKAKHGGDDGNAITVTIVDPGSNNAVLQVNVATVDDITVSLATDGGGALTSTAAQVKAAVEANTTAAALVDVSLVLGPGSSAMAAAGFGALSGGEDGKILSITAAGVGGNNGLRKIATLIDARTVRLGSHLALAALAVDPVLARWKKNPNFSTEASLEWEVVGTGTVAAGGVLTFQRALYAATVAVEVAYLTTRTGIILTNEFDRNTGAQFPFYLADPLAFVRGIIDTITVAGVIPRYR